MVSWVSLSSEAAPETFLSAFFHSPSLSLSCRLIIVLVLPLVLLAAKRNQKPIIDKWRVAACAFLEPSLDHRTTSATQAPWQPLMCGAASCAVRTSALPCPPCVTHVCGIVACAYAHACRCECRWRCLQTWLSEKWIFSLSARVRLFFCASFCVKVWRVQMSHFFEYDNTFWNFNSTFCWSILFFKQ